MKSTGFGFEPNPERTKPKTTRPRVEEPESTCIAPRKKTIFTKGTIDDQYMCVPIPIILLFVIGILLGGTMLGIGFGIASMTHSCPNVVCCTNSSSVCGNGILENGEECDYGDRYSDSHSTYICVNCKLVSPPSYYSPTPPPQYD